MKMIITMNDGANENHIHTDENGNKNFIENWTFFSLDLNSTYLTLECDCFEINVPQKRLAKAIIITCADIEFRNALEGKICARKHIIQQKINYCKKEFIIIWKLWN